VVLFFVLADQEGKDGSEEHEDERLNETHQQFMK